MLGTIIIWTGKQICTFGVQKSITHLYKNKDKIIKVTINTTIKTLRIIDNYFK